MYCIGRKSIAVRGLEELGIMGQAPILGKQRTEYRQTEIRLNHREQTLKKQKSEFWSQ
jgi:hypothetical protein